MNYFTTLQWQTEYHEITFVNCLDIYILMTTPSYNLVDFQGTIRPIITYLQDKFAQLYLPHREVSVDEAMIKFQGRSSLKQYMPQKTYKKRHKSVGAGRCQYWLLLEV